MDIKEQYRRAYSLLRYMAIDLTGDCYPRNLVERNTEAEIAMLSAVAIGAAWKSQNVTWERSWEKKRYLTMMQYKPRDVLLISVDIAKTLTEKQIKAIRKEATKEHAKHQSKWLAEQRKRVMTDCRSHYHPMRTPVIASTRGG